MKFPARVADASLPAAEEGSSEAIRSCVQAVVTGIRACECTDWNASSRMRKPHARAGQDHRPLRRRIRSSTSRHEPAIRPYPSAGRPRPGRSRAVASGSIWLDCTSTGMSSQHGPGRPVSAR